MKKLIAIVENDIDTLEILSMILSDEGFDILAIQNFVDVEEITAASPALIILDERLDNVFGHEICRSIKLNPRTNGIPVLLFSAMNDVESIAIACHADGYISKPFDIDNLIQVVNKAVSG